MSLSPSLLIDTTHQNEYKCPICTNIIQKCYSSKCGHLFCENCIMGLLLSLPNSENINDNNNQTETCPVCSKTLIMNELFPCTYVDNKIINLSIKCINYTFGCQWIGSIYSLKEKHIKNCGFNKVNCKGMKNSCNPT